MASTWPGVPEVGWRGTVPIGSAFLRVELRTKDTGGAGSPAAAAPAMACDLVESAQARWRAITGTHQVSPVRAGARFEYRVLVVRQEPVV
ncbi:hypothetical protein ABZ622_38025 [Streptomyces sp. NPDC007164]|uniref:hypothetical protein n=1 Tax=Streptomyces sp. NPDC007164 TaxID=3156918 RepID=UPI003402BF9E